MNIQTQTEQFLNTLPSPRQLVEAPDSTSTTVDGRVVRQHSTSKVEVPSHSHKTEKTEKPLHKRHSKKEDKTKQTKESHSKHKKESHGKDVAKTGFFSESHFGIRDNLSKGFHHIFQILGLEAPATTQDNEATAIQETIQNSGHTSPLLVVNNALFHLVNTIDNRFFGDKIPDKAVDTVRDIVGKIVEHVNLNTLPDILKKTNSGRGQSSQAPASLQEVIDANQKDNAIAQALPKALEALTGVTGLKPKSLGLGDNIRLGFNYARLNLTKAIELIKEILKSDFALGTLLMDLIPHFVQSIFGEHKAEKAERLEWN